MTTIQNNAVITIKGNHFFGCDYIFSNIYGSSVFTEENKDNKDNELSDDKISQDPEKGDFSPETFEEFIKYDSNPFDLSSMPESTNKIEYSINGTYEFDGHNATIRYEGDFSPICIHVSNDTMHLSGQEDNFSELIFQSGKRNYVVLPESLFTEIIIEENENQSPLTLCIDTKHFQNNLSETGGTLFVNYSIEVNSIIAEVTEIYLEVLCDMQTEKEGLF